MNARTYGKVLAPFIKLKKALHLEGAWARITKRVRELLPWRILKDIKERSKDIERNVNRTFDAPDAPEELGWYTTIAPKAVSRLLLASAQDFGRVNWLCWVTAFLQWVGLYICLGIAGVGSKSPWLYVVAIAATFINAAIVLIAWWLAIALTSTLGADGLHIVAYHNVGNYPSAKLGVFARVINELITFTEACKVGNQTCNELHWLNIRAHFDHIARSYAMFGFIRLIGCYLIGIFVFGLTCAWWTLVLGNGSVIMGFHLDRWAWLDMAYFLSIAAVTIGFGDFYFLGIAGKLIGWALCGNLLLNALFIITWYHTYAFSFKERLFAGVCNKAGHPDWLDNRSILY